MEHDACRRHILWRHVAADAARKARRWNSNDWTSAMSKISFPRNAAPAPVVRSDSGTTSSSAAAASPSEQASRRPRASIRQSAVENMKRFARLFEPSSGNAPNPSRNSTSRISSKTISQPMVRADPQLLEFEPLKDHELRPEIEGLCQAAKASHGSATSIDWARYEKLDAIADEVRHLKARLSVIYAKTNACIDEVRLTAYQQIRAARQAPDTSNASDSGNARNADADMSRHRKTLSALAAIPKASRQKPSAAPARRSAGLAGADAAEEYKATVEQAIGSFTGRTAEFVNARRRDIDKACQELLEKHFAERFPEAPLCRLMHEISPEAAMPFVKKLVEARFDSPLLASIVADAPSAEVLELFAWRRPDKS